MRISLVLLFTLVVVPFFTFGQITLDYKSQETIDFFKRNQFISGSGNRTLSESNIKGSPYLNDEFFYGSIYTNQKQHFADIPLRYNIYNDDLEFKTPEGKVQALATPEIVELAIFGNTKLVYTDYQNKNNIKKGFFVVIEQGKVSLYSKPRVLFKEGTEPGAYKDPEPPKFVRTSDDYYLQLETGPAVGVGSKKELLAFFPDQQEKVKTFISKNKTKPNKEESLLELVKYYNSL
jgi:hypothetical protein